jgi:hypothetical protein
MRAGGRTIYSLPYSSEMSDLSIFWQSHATSDQFVTQVCDYFDLIYQEAAKYGGRVMTLALNPWIIGYPYRIRALNEALSHIMNHDSVWATTGSELLDVFAEQGSA